MGRARKPHEEPLDTSGLKIPVRFWKKGEHARVWTLRTPTSKHAAQTPGAEARRALSSAPPRSAERGAARRSESARPSAAGPQCAGSAGGAPRRSASPQPGPAGGPAPHPQPRTGGPLPSAGGWAERGGANGSGRAAPGAGAAEPLGEQRGSERRGGRGRGRRGSRPCGAAGEARSRQPGALRGRRLGVNEAGEAGMAGVSYSPPWWVSLLHRLPHLSLRWELTAADFRPDDAEYQQVSAAVRARCRGGAASPPSRLVPCPPRPGAFRAPGPPGRTRPRVRCRSVGRVVAMIAEPRALLSSPSRLSEPRPPGSVGCTILLLERTRAVLEPQPLLREKGSGREGAGGAAASAAIGARRERGFGG